MKRILFAVFTFFMFISMYAQQSAEVDYTYVENPGIEIPFDYKLITSENNSVYFEVERQVEYLDQVKTTQEGEVFYDFSGLNEAVTKNKLYLDFDKGTNIEVLHVKNKTTHIHDLPPRLDWNITDENKEIGEYIAIKAEVTFRGRDYEAWFTPEIPISAGPWKLHGLPGLILEAKDNANTFYWLAERVKYPIESDEEMLVIDKNKAEVKIGIQEYVKTRIKGLEKLKNIYASRTQNDLENHNIDAAAIPGKETWLEREYEWE